jgi:hypothetical protein
MRINGGHSVLNDSKFHDTLYHGTTQMHYNDGIKTEGLKASKHETGHGAVHVTTDPDMAKEYAHYKAEENGSHPIVLHINRNHPSVRGFSKDLDIHTPVERGVAFHTENDIPRNAIKKVQRLKKEY